MSQIFGGLKVDFTMLFKKGKRGQFGELLAGQPHFSLWEDDGANNSESHFQTQSTKRWLGEVSMDLQKENDSW